MMLMIMATMVHYATKGTNEEEPKKPGNNSNNEAEMKKIEEEMA